MAEETKTYVFDSQAGRSSATDPSALYAMMMNNGFGGNGNWLLILFMFFLYPIIGRNFGGYGNDGIPNQLNNDYGRSVLLQAINGNGTAISQLATTLNCDVNAIQTAINGVQTSILNVGNSVGLTGQQIINSIQSGNAGLASQLATSCCENRLAICQQTNALQQAISSVATGQERGFSSVSYEMQSQTCDLRDAINNGVSKIVSGQQAAEMRELQRDIAERDRKISEQAVTINNGQQSALFGQMIGQAIAPINAALNGLQKGLADVESKMPATTTIPYSPVTAVPTLLAYQYGFGLNNGSIWA